MNRPVKLLSIIAAAWLASSAAMAGTDIVKCVDPQGHVTLTDQPCESGATATRLVQDGGVSSASAQQADAPAVRQRHVLPVVDTPRQLTQRQIMDRPAPLARDIATLQAARRALMLMDSRPTLAGLQ
jgi:hypothetical protein